MERLLYHQVAKSIDKGERMSIGKNRKINKSLSYIERISSETNYFSAMGGRRIEEGLVVIFTDEKISLKGKIENQFVQEGYKTIIDTQMSDLNNCRVDIFVNIVFLNDKDKLYETEQFSRVYEKCQEEANFFMNGNMSGHIVTILVCDDIHSIVAETMKKMIEGLGYALGGHKIIANGLIVDADVDFENWTSWMRFLASKYGDALAGNVLELSNEIGSEGIIQSC